MSGRPVRRRVLKAVEQAGGWPVILARIAGGESIVAVARSYRVSRSFFSRLLHEDRDRHALAVEAQRRATGDALLAEAALLIERGTRPDAERLRAVLGERAADLDRATLAVLDRLCAVLTGEGVVTPGISAWELAMQHTSPLDVGRLHLEALRAQPVKAPAAPAVTLCTEVQRAEPKEE